MVDLFKKEVVRINLDKDICNLFHIELSSNEVNRIKFCVADHEIDVSEVTAFGIEEVDILKY